ncbi:ABC transporter substrate-binding protein [Nitratireductor sp. XY-223]|uniref:ABC transporter substrate-binding protein n=1 Tax=Nitratireductor sp. XY-223 TaxID=2561926 RepID=UPI0010A9B472|nr:ABC transporter substrate-binding protein [Nitratireductor sp. XY-223]
MTGLSKTALRKGLMTAGALVLTTALAHGDEAAEQFRTDFLGGKLSWEDVSKRAAEEGKVNFYYWGGSDTINVWIDSVAAPAMKELGVTLNPVRITSTKDAIDLVLAEKNSGKGVGEGSVDAVWVNGENFYTLKQQEALFGSFAESVPNSANFDWNPDDPRSLLNLRDFGVTTDSQEIPWSGQQYVCAVNRQYVDAADTPSTFEEMKAYLEKNPGKFTYVKPPHWVGNTFVQSVMYSFNPDGNGGVPFQQSIDDLGAAELARLIKPGMEYLKSIEPLLLDADGGKPRYPEDIAALDGMFLNGEVYFNCKFGLYAVHTGLQTGAYPEKAEAFIFPKGVMIANKNYLAIPANSPNPASALLLANYMASVDSQASKLQNAGMPVGIDVWKLSADDAAKVKDAAPPLYGVTQAELDANVAPDTNASLVDVIEATWLEYIERGSSSSIEEIVDTMVKQMAQ